MKCSRCNKEATKLFKLWIEVCDYHFECLKFDEEVTYIEKDYDSNFENLKFA